MHILITGGTGLIGRALIKKIVNSHQVTVLTRNTNKASILFNNHDIALIADLTDIDFNQVDAIVNLAGESIGDKRWSKQQKQCICQSRWQLTAQISQFINEAIKPPHTLISGSAIGYYGRQDQQLISEAYDDCYQEFTHDVCQQWEAVAQRSASSKTRVCLLRTGIVLAKDGGALSQMSMPFKFGLGAVIGDGKQYMSWVHIDDMVRIIEHCLTSEIHGAINATAPTPETNETFSKELAIAMGKPCWFRLPAWLMKGLLGEQADLIIYGQRVIPSKLQANGFEFTYPKVDTALGQIYTQAT